jgi:hypothetical protein
MSQINIPVTVDWGPTTVALNSMFTELYGQAGGATYTDGQYTEATPFVLVANVITSIPNNKATAVETQLPVDLTTLYNGTGVLAAEGDGALITVSFLLKPTVTATDQVEVWIDTTAGIGTPIKDANLFKGTTGFKQLVGAERPILYSINAQASALWGANGARLKVRANGACGIYDISYTVNRVSKAR